MKNQKGFTLLELALAMLVVGIIVSLLASGLQTYLQKTRIDTTKHRMEVVEKAIANFLDVNRRYPCPARVNVPPGVTNFGVETTNPTVSPDITCVGGNGLGGGGTFTDGANDVRIGSVPVRSLNLIDEYLVDGWGNRFTYAVTQVLASDDPGGNGTLYLPNDGKIRMRDSGGAVFVDDAHFTLVSHGETGNGSFKLFSTVTNPPIACPTTGLDRDNCDYASNNFRVTLLNSENGASFFDDYVRYQGQQKADNVPPGAIMAFDRNCPNGWTTYTQAEGRVVLGARDNNGTEPPNNLPRYQYIDDGTPADITAATSGATYNLRAQSDIEDDNGTGPDAYLLPPYVALRYCRKD